jgi:hypothetical protein
METLTGWYSPLTRKRVSTSARISEIRGELSDENAFMPLEAVIGQFDGSPLTYRRYLEINLAGLEECKEEPAPVHRPAGWWLDPKRDARIRKCGYSSATANALAVYDAAYYKSMTWRQRVALVKKVSAETGVSAKTIRDALTIRRKRRWEASMKAKKSITFDSAT